MTAPPPPRLVRMRIAASSILAAMAGIYVFSRSYQESWPWLEWLRAFSEAGMVGGLADWFAVTALFRRPLGLPIPHTAVIPREKNRIGNALARFVRGNFLTAELICKQARELDIIRRTAVWTARPEHAAKLAGQVLRMLPAALDALEKNNTHTLLTNKLAGQLRGLNPNELTAKLLAWLLAENRYRRLLAPALAHLAAAVSSNKSRIEQAAGDQAPLTRVPLLGRISRAIAEGFSERTAENIEARLTAASGDETDPLWDVIHGQIMAARNQFLTNTELQKQMETIRDAWLDNRRRRELADRLWLRIRQQFDADLQRDPPASAGRLADVIAAAGTSLGQTPGLAEKIEDILLDGVEHILDRHSSHIETMIRRTIEDWDADTLMQKLEQQVGPDLQFIRINGTLIGGLVGLALHGAGKLLW